MVMGDIKPYGFPMTYRIACSGCELLSALAARGSGSVRFGDGVFFHKGKVADNTGSRWLLACDLD